MHVEGTALLTQVWAKQTCIVKNANAVGKAEARLTWDNAEWSDEKTEDSKQKFILKRLHG